MHPEIRRNAPGNCPICGMALEPLEPSLEEGPNPELVDMTRRLWICAVLTIPLLVLTMGAELTGWEPLPMRLSVWLQLAIATPVVLWGAAPFFERGWQSLRNRSLNMFTLISIGVGAAWLYSLVATLAPGLFPDAARTMGGMVPVYFEAAAVITTLVRLGQGPDLLGHHGAGRLGQRPGIRGGRGGRDVVAAAGEQGDAGTEGKGQETGTSLRWHAHLRTRAGQRSS